MDINYEFLESNNCYIHNLKTKNNNIIANIIDDKAHKFPTEKIVDTINKELEPLEETLRSLDEMSFFDFMRLDENKAGARENFVKEFKDNVKKVADKRLEKARVKVNKKLLNKIKQENLKKYKVDDTLDPVADGTRSLLTLSSRSSDLNDSRSISKSINHYITPYFSKYYDDMVFANLRSFDEKAPGLRWEDIYNRAKFLCGSNAGLGWDAKEKSFSFKSCIKILKSKARKAGENNERKEQRVKCDKTYGITNAKNLRREDNNCTEVILPYFKDLDKAYKKSFRKVKKSLKDRIAKKKKSIALAQKEFREKLIYGKSSLLCTLNNKSEDNNPNFTGVTQIKIKDCNRSICVMPKKCRRWIEEKGFLGFDKKGHYNKFAASLQSICLTNESDNKCPHHYKCRDQNDFSFDRVIYNVSEAGEGDNVNENNTGKFVEEK